MLNQQTETFANDTHEITTPVVAESSNAVATVQADANTFTALVNRFQRELGMAVLPAEATTGCTVINGGIRFGGNMEQDAGDFLVLNPQNITRYKKLDLGIPNPTADEKKLTVSCYDGATVVQGEETYSMDDYLNKVKSLGYSKASWKDRAVIHGLYVTCDRADKINLSEDDGLFAVYLSPSSLKSWDAFVTKSSLFKQFGNIKLTKVAKSWNGTNWTQFGFEIYREDLKKAA